MEILSTLIVNIKHSQNPLVFLEANTYERGSSHLNRIVAGVHRLVSWSSTATDCPDIVVKSRLLLGFGHGKVCVFLGVSRVIHEYNLYLCVAVFVSQVYFLRVFDCSVDLVDVG